MQHGDPQLPHQRDARGHAEREPRPSFSVGPGEGLEQGSARPQDRGTGKPPHDARPQPTFDHVLQRREGDHRERHRDQRERDDPVHVVRDVDERLDVSGGTVEDEAGVGKEGHEAHEQVQNAVADVLPPRLQCHAADDHRPNRHPPCAEPVDDGVHGDLRHGEGSYPPAPSHHRFLPRLSTSPPCSDRPGSAGGSIFGVPRPPQGVICGGHSAWLSLRHRPCWEFSASVTLFALDPLPLSFLTSALGVTGDA